MTITISDKQIPLRFGYYCTKAMLEATQKRTGFFMTDDGKFTPEGTAKLLHAAYCNAMYAKDEDPQYGLDFFIDYIEGTPDLEMLAKVYDSLGRQQYNEVGSGGAKKKSGGDRIDFEEIECILYGELNWKPGDLRHSSFKDVLLAVHGHREKQKYDYEITRRLAFTIAGAGMNKDLAKNISRMWPSTEKKEADTNMIEKALLNLKRSRK